MPLSSPPQRRFVLLGCAAAIILLFLALPTRTNQFESTTPEAIPSNGRPKTNIYDADDLDRPAGHSTPANKPAIDDSISTSHGVVQSSAQLQRTDIETTTPLVLRSLDSDVKIGAYTWGFNVLDKLYLRNGTFYLVTNDQKSLPSKAEIMLKLHLETQDDEEDEGSHIVEFITPAQAKTVLGEYATVISGVSLLVLDPPSFLVHFYHFWGEVILGAWRVYSTLALSKDTTALDRLPMPSRIIFPFVTNDEWRDRANLDGPVMRLAWPEALIESSGVWNDWKKIGGTIVFERSITVNRYSAHKSPLGFVWFKMISSTQNLTAPLHFWEPIRKSAMKSLFGYAPQVADTGKPVSPPQLAPAPGSHSTSSASGGELPNLPIVTYISRQSTGRRLIPEDHAVLVKVLRELEKEGLCILRIPVMEKLTLQQQFAEVASSTIMVGVHGNGLTHQMFMPPSLRSTVFEIVYPGDYAFDYWMLAKNMGHKHYMVRNDTLTTYGPDKWNDGVHFSEFFHGDAIPVYGPVIADMVRKRLTQPASEVEA